jgi:hypothetical protein
MAESTAILRPRRARPWDAGPEATARDLAALQFVGEQYVVRSDVLAVLLGRLSPAMRRLTRAAIRAALVGAGRRRNLQARVVAVHDALAAPQLAVPEPIEAAYREVVGALVAMLRCGNQQVAALEQQLTSQFAAHADATIVRSQTGLGWCWEPGCWASSATTLTAIRRPRATRPSPAPRQ